MHKQDIILTLDSIEADVYRLFRRIGNLRAELTKEIDPRGQRRDLGYRPELEQSESAAEMRGDA